MNVRRVCVGLAVVAAATAMGCVAIPVSTTVPVSLVPFQEFFGDLQVRAGSKFGVTLSVADSAVTLECGSVAEPADIEVDVGGDVFARAAAEVSDFIFDIESQLQRGCDQAIEQRRSWAVGLGAAGMTLLLVGLLAGSSRDRRRVGSTRDPEYVLEAMYLGTHPAAERTLSDLRLSIRRGGLVVRSKRSVLATMPWRRVRALEVQTSGQLASWADRTGAALPRRAWQRRWRSYLAIDDERGRWVFATAVNPTALELELDGIRATTSSGAWGPPPSATDPLAAQPSSAPWASDESPSLSSALGRKRGTLPQRALWIFAAVLAGGVVTVLALRSSADGGATMSISGAEQVTTTTEDPRLAVERACIEYAMETADADYETASMRSTQDRDGAVLNMDGDDSYVEFASDMLMIDVTACPADFQSAFAHYAQTWADFGGQWLSATRGPVSRGMSDADRTQLLLAINQARSELAAVASEHGASVTMVTLS